MVQFSAAGYDSRVAGIDEVSVRFGRMAADIQKLSNEVFLALRAAHDAAAKNLRKRSGPIPTTRAQPASGPTAVPTGAASLPSAPQPQPGRIIQQPPPKLARPN